MNEHRELQSAVLKQRDRQSNDRAASNEHRAVLKQPDRATAQTTPFSLAQIEMLKLLKMEESK